MGLLELLLRGRYGEPRVEGSNVLTEYRWNEDAETLTCVLYKSPDLNNELRSRFASLVPLYGDAAGGFLLGNSLRVSMLEGPRLFGHYHIGDLNARAEVRHAKSYDAGICFFMDSANVWFYGLKHERLYVYDSETDELDCLGPAQMALEKLLGEWERAKT